MEFEGPYYDQWPTAAHKAIFASAADRRRSRRPRQVIRSFATRAFRRPVLAAEENALLGIYRTSASSGRGFRDSIREALAAALTMPQFLFLVEKSATPAPEALNDYELASKLSFISCGTARPTAGCWTWRRRENCAASATLKSAA